jgi:hypothetical protein
VAGIRIPISHACSRGKIKVVEIRRLSGGSFSSSLINLAIKLAGATSANIAGKEYKDENEAENASDGEDSSDCACIMKETDNGLARI